MTQEKRVKIGVVGCGSIAQAVHLKILPQLPEAELIAFADSDSAQLERAAEIAPTARGFRDYRELLTLPNLAAVIIATPNQLHAEAAIAAFQERHHVYLEKPLALNAAECEAVIKAWQRAGTVGMIGFNYRFNKLNQELRSALHQGMIGAPVIARTSFCTPPAQAVWKYARAKGGGVLLDLATHHVDLLRYCLGQEVEAVFAQIWSQQTEDDHALLQLKLTGGVAAQCFFSFGVVEEDRLEVYGSAGKLEVNRYLFDGVRRRSGSARTLRREQLTDLMPTIKGARYLMDKKQEPLHEPSYRVALARFVGAVRTGQQTTPDLSDGLRAQMVIEAAEESNRRGCTVVIPTVQAIHANEVER